MLTFLFFTILDGLMWSVQRNQCIFTNIFTLLVKYKIYKCTLQTVNTCCYYCVTRFHFTRLAPMSNVVATCTVLAGIDKKDSEFKIVVITHCLKKYCRQCIVLNLSFPLVTKSKTSVVCSQTSLGPSRTTYFVMRSASLWTSLNLVWGLIKYLAE